MCHACGEQREGVEALAFQCLLGLLAAGGEIAYQHDIFWQRVVRVPVTDRCDVEIEVAVFGIKDLDVAAYGFGGLHERVQWDQQVAAETGPDGTVRMEAEKPAGRLVDERDDAVSIKEDHAFAESFENLFEQSFLADQAGEELLCFAPDSTRSRRETAFQESLLSQGSGLIACFFRVSCGA